jgi:hypothetical protein
MDAASHRALEEFVREVTAPERDALVKLSLEVEQIEVRLGMRPKPKHFSGGSEACCASATRLAQLGGGTGV